MGIEVIMLPPQLQRFNEYCLYSVALKHYFDQFFYATPLNIHHNECMCYNAKQAFKVQYLGRLDTMNDHWTWAFSHPEHHPMLYHTVNSLKDEAVAWEDKFFLEKRGIPCDSFLLFWLHTIASTFSHSPIVISQKVGHGHTEEYFVINDRELLTTLEHYQKQHPHELSEHILTIWHNFSPYVALAHAPGESLAFMCTKLGINHDLHPEHVTIPEAKLRFEAPFTEHPLSYRCITSSAEV